METLLQHLLRLYLLENVPTFFCSVVSTRVNWPSKPIASLVSTRVHIHRHQTLLLLSRNVPTPTSFYKPERPRIIRIMIVSGLRQCGRQNQIATDSKIVGGNLLSVRYPLKWETDVPDIVIAGGRQGGGPDQ